MRLTMVFSSMMIYQVFLFGAVFTQIRGDKLVPETSIIEIEKTINNFLPSSDITNFIASDDTLDDFETFNFNIPVIEVQPQVSRVAPVNPLPLPLVQELDFSGFGFDDFDFDFEQSEPAPPQPQSISPKTTVENIPIQVNEIQDEPVSVFINNAIDSHSQSHGSPLPIVKEQIDHDGTFGLQPVVQTNQGKPISDVKPTSGIIALVPDNVGVPIQNIAVQIPVVQKIIKGTSHSNIESNQHHENKISHQETGVPLPKLPNRVTVSRRPISHPVSPPRQPQTAPKTQPSRPRSTSPPPTRPPTTKRTVVTTSRFTPAPTRRPSVSIPQPIKEINDNFIDHGRQLNANRPLPPGPYFSLTEGDYPRYETIPETLFQCPSEGYGYFADIETGCQAFHVCQDGIEIAPQLCPMQTVFNQRWQTCDWWFNVDCSSSEKFYFLNDRIGIEDSDLNI